MSFLSRMACRFWISAGSNVKEQGSEYAESVQIDVKSGQRPKDYLEGYAELAEFIASDDDFLLFRRFGALGARNLLYLQAEVQVLEAQLKQLDEDDRIDTMNASNISEKTKVERFARDWEFMIHNPRDENERQAKKLNLINSIRKAMKDYRMLF